jgi:ADP-heptose:LPS heptosyltransferase
MTRVLIVQPQGIGDAVMMIPAIAGLRASEPDLTIGAVVRVAAAADLLRGSALCNAVFVLDRRAVGLRGAIRALRLIRGEFRPDVCVVAPYVSPLFGEPFAFLVGARVRIGSHSVWPFGGYTDTVPCSLEMHKTRGTLECLRRVFPLCREGRLFWDVDDWADARASEIFQRLGLSAKILLGVHPGTDGSGRMRRYPPEYFERIFSLFRDAYPQSSILVFLGPSEEDLEPRFHGVGGVSVLKRLPLAVVAALIRRTTVFLSADSALAHVAAAMGVPVVTIFGPADPRRTQPRAAAVRVVRHRPVLSCMPCIDTRMYTACRTRPCLTSLMPADVFRVVRELVGVDAPQCRTA